MIWPNIYHGDILKLIQVQRHDVLVNPGNPATARGGALCGAIWEAAGWGNARMVRLGLQVSECLIGDAGNLPCYAVIHTVGPKWILYSPSMCKALLNATYSNVFKLAIRNGHRTIAVPTISAGAYGYPLQEACEIAVYQARRFTQKIHITLVAYDQQAFDAYQRVMR